MDQHASEVAPHPDAGIRPESGARLRGLAARLIALPDTGLAMVVALALFALAAWPLLLVALPPLQDLPNHLAAAHIAAHPDRYPEYVFNGFLKSNSLLTLWLHLVGRHDLLAAGRAFCAIALAANAFALPCFLLHFGGRRRMLVATLFVWPLVHGFFLSMGMLNFAFAFPLSLLLLVALDLQRRTPSLPRALGCAALSMALWYAHPFPLVVVIGLAIVEVAFSPRGRGQVAAGVALLLPLLPVGALVSVTVFRHLIKADGAPPGASAAFAYLPPWTVLLHFWLDASGALTRFGSMTIVPALLLPYFAWLGRGRRDLPFFGRGTLVLGAAYLGLPVMLSNWWYLSCRLVPLLWVALALRVPTSLSKRTTGVLLACALSFSATLGIDYVRLDRDRAAFTAGISAVPARAALLPLLFRHRRTSDFTASLTHAWAYYVLARDTSAPLVFAVERSYAITYAVFPPPALIPPALDRLAELHGTPERHCLTDHLAVSGRQAGCIEDWRARWRAFWAEAEPRFTHVLTWAMPPGSRELIPPRFQRTFVAGDLEIYARVAAAPGTSAAQPPAGSASRSPRAP